MNREPLAASTSNDVHRPHVNSALRVSQQSVIWTVVSSGLALYLGIRDHTAVLLAFGAVGFVDAVGSMALVRHFKHGLRHDELSDDLERLAHRVVLVGLFTVGCAAIVGGLVRLSGTQSEAASASSVILAAVSLGALVALSYRKQQVARLISSYALRSDGHLSAIGAMQAAVTLLGIATTRWLGWHWADAAATVIVGCVAVALAGDTWRRERQDTSGDKASPDFLKVAVALMALVAIVDALLGAHLILIGLLVAGPIIGACSCRLRVTATTSVAAVALAVALGAPDHIWLTREHAVWIGAIGLVGLADSALIAVIAPNLRQRH